MQAVQPDVETPALRRSLTVACWYASGLSSVARALAPFGHTQALSYSTRGPAIQTTLQKGRLPTRRSTPRT